MPPVRFVRIVKLKEKEKEKEELGKKRGCQHISSNSPQRRSRPYLSTKTYEQKTNDEDKLTDILDAIKLLKMKVGILLYKVDANNNEDKLTCLLNAIEMLRLEVGILSSKFDTCD